ncbi:MAG: alpha/beta hydrolase [Xanthobacteraceae bacterium]
MNLVSIPANPVPEKAVAGSLRTPDGIELRYARWAPPAGRKGTVCLFQGRAEFIEKYYETVVDLRTRGFAVATLDWRGQGLSQRLLPDRNKGYVRSFADYDLDLETFMRELVLPDCPPPIFAIGHSMGGTILLRAMYRGHRWFDRIVLSAPMIALRGGGLLGAASTLARVMRLMGMGSSYVPGGDRLLVGSGPFVGNILTSDPVRYARNAAVLEMEPALGIAAPTIAWADSAFKVMADFTEHASAAKIRQPILMIGAGRDQVVSTQAMEEFAVRLRAGSHLTVAGSEHEILMEQDRYRRQFWAAFDAFVPGTPLFG